MIDADVAFQRELTVPRFTYSRCSSLALPSWIKSIPFLIISDNMRNQQSSPFRVVVVGGGVAGLTAAHALWKANIDHVVLERGTDPAPPTGASIAIYPHGARILKQIDCLQAAKDACTPMDSFINRMPDGSAIVDSRFFDFVKEKYVSLSNIFCISLARGNID
jgi:FAD dependent oxidoreductase